MKITIISLAAALAFVGCSQRDKSINESAGAQKDQIEQSKDAQKDSLKEQKKSVEREADLQKKQIGDQSKANKESIEARADADQAQLSAQEKQVEADAKAQKAQVDATKEVQEAAGAATDARNSDSALEAKIREAIYGAPDATQVTSTSAKNVKVKAKDGMITLKGSVGSEAEKTECETKAKSVSGVISVDNKIEVKTP